SWWRGGRGSRKGWRWAGSMRYSTVTSTGAAIMIDRLRGQRRRPMHRRREIEGCAGLQFPTPGQRDRGHGAGGGEKMRIGNPDENCHLAPRRAADRQAAEKNGRVECQAARP